MTLSQLQWRLLYASNMLVQKSIQKSNEALAKILAPKRTRATRRTKKS